MLGVRVGHQGAGGHVAAGEHLTVKQDRSYSLTYEQVSYIMCCWRTCRAELAMIWKGATSLEYGETGGGGW